MAPRAHRARCQNFGLDPPARNLQDLEMDFECEIHEKGEIKSMIELQSGKYQGYLLTGGDDFSFKLVRIREDQHEYEIISSYGARGPVQSICQL